MIEYAIPFQNSKNIILYKQFILFDSISIVTWIMYKYIYDMLTIRIFSKRKAHFNKRISRRSAKHSAIYISDKILVYTKTTDLYVCLGVDTKSHL